MSNHYRTNNEIAITLEEHRELTKDRNRPLTDGYMSNEKASRVRAEQAVRTDDSVTSTVLHILEGARGNIDERVATVLARIPPEVDLPPLRGRRRGAA